MSNQITSDWNNRDETVVVGDSVFSDRILIVRPSRADEAIRVDVDDLLEAIYEEYPDRRPVSSEQPLEAEPEWHSAKVIAGEQKGRTRYMTKIPGGPDGQDWMLDSGVAYSHEEVEWSFTDIETVVPAGD